MDDNLKALLYLFGGALAFLAGAKLVMALRDGTEVYDYYEPWPEAETPSGCRNVALLGNSLTAGVTYRVELEALLGPCNAVQAFAHPGKGTAYIRDRLDAALAWGPTDLVVLAGVNDLASGRGVDTVIENLEWIYQTAHEAGVRVVAVTLTPWAGNKVGKNLQAETQEVNDWISWYSTADVVVDTSSMGDEDGYAYDDYVGKDGLHLTASGQMALALLVRNQAFGW